MKLFLRALIVALLLAVGGVLAAQTAKHLVRPLAKPLATTKQGASGAASGVAYSYYRFTGLDDNSSGGAQQAWREIKGFEASDNTGTNLFQSLYLAALASRALNEDHKVFDGNPNTYWDSFARTSGDHQWIQVQLSEARIIRSVTLDPYASFWQPANMKIEGSNNGSDWTELTTFATSYNTNADIVVADVQS